MPIPGHDVHIAVFKRNQAKKWHIPIGISIELSRVESQIILGAGVVEHDPRNHPVIDFVINRTRSSLVIRSKGIATLARNQGGSSRQTAKASTTRKIEPKITQELIFIPRTTPTGE